MRNEDVGTGPGKDMLRDFTFSHPPVTGNDVTQGEGAVVWGSGAWWGSVSWRKGRRELKVEMRARLFLP